jgi:hypothetical protein
VSLTETPASGKKQRIRELFGKARYFLESLFTRNNMATTSFLAGIAMASYGASLYEVALGWLVGGSGLIIFGYLLGQE